MNNEKLISEISQLISILRSQVELSGSLNLLSINVHCENFYRDLLNELYDLELINTNFSDQNSASIDLIDLNSKIAYQVTSDPTLDKVRHTITKFLEHEINLKVDSLIILNISQKKNHREQYIESGIFKFDTKNNIIDHRDILKKINDLNIDKLQLIHKIVNQYINPNWLLPASNNPSQKLSSIHKILEGISDIEHDVKARELDVLPYTIEQKIDYNNLVFYKKYLSKFQNFAWVIQSQIEILEQNGQPTISSKLYKYVDGKFMYFFLNQLTPDYLVHHICEDIKNDLEKNKVLSITLDDIAYVPYVVFYVFSKCKIFEKPPC